MPKAAIILSGCGVYDGSEITETVLLTLSLDSKGIDYAYFAPNISQLETIDHATGYATNDNRNCLTESARIARGDIQPLENLKMEAFDWLVFPGGFGVAKNLSNHATAHSEYNVLPSIEKLIQDFHQAKKPIIAACIAPVLLAKALEPNIQMTLGSDPTYSKLLEGCNKQAIETSCEEFSADDAHRVYTTAAYMDPKATPSKIYTGFSKLINHITATL